MTKLKVYLDYIRANGHSLMAINPGSDELALSATNAISAIELLKIANAPVLGGDILTCNSEGLIYVYQSWGSEYHCLNWYCDKSENETHEQYVRRSFDTAMRAINQAVDIATKLNRSCYVVLVV